MLYDKPHHIYHTVESINKQYIIIVTCTYAVELTYNTVLL